MPIHCPVQIKCLDAAGFEALDYRVMGHAYASQNELGRLCDECAYKADLKARLLADGFRSVLTEVPVTVTHRDPNRVHDNSINGKGMNGRRMIMKNLFSIPLPFIPLPFRFDSHA